MNEKKKPITLGKMSQSIVKTWDDLVEKDPLIKDRTQMVVKWIIQEDKKKK